MKYLRTYITGFMALVFLGACTRVHSQYDIRPLEQLGPKEGIVLLSNRENDHDFDDDVDKCIRPAMLRAHPDINFVTAKQFRENLYPYFFPSTTPKDLEGYKRVLDRPEVLRRINSLGVRYLIMLTKDETLTDWHGGILCGGGPGGGACLGLSWWDRKSELSLVVWDLKNRTCAANVEAKSAGTGIMPAFLLPIPFYVPATRSAVCNEIANRLGKLLSGQD
jgi:hypothetical protein